MPLFGRCLLEVGTETEDFVRLSQRIGARTGGLSAHTLVTGQRHGDRAVARFFLRGKAMVDRTGDLVDIVRDVLTTVRLDNRDRLLQMALEDKAGEEAGLVPGGHSVVALRLCSRFDEASWVSEQMDGVSYLFYLRRLVERIRHDWPSVLDQLEAVRSHLVDRDTLLLNATLADADRAAVEPHLAGLAESLPSRGGSPREWSPRLGGADEGLTLPAQVNYVGKGGDLYAQGYELRGSVAVITKYLRTSYLWDRVRVQGGAYGAFCSFDPFTGVFGFGSYRDPNLLETLGVYDGAAAFLRGLDLSEERAHQGDHRRHRRDGRLPAPRRQGIHLDGARADRGGRRLPPGPARPRPGDHGRRLPRLRRAAGGPGRGRERGRPGLAGGDRVGQRRARWELAPGHTGHVGGDPP